MAVAQAALDSRFRAVAIIWRCAGRASPSLRPGGDDLDRQQVAGLDPAEIPRRIPYHRHNCQDRLAREGAYMPKLAVVTPCFRDDAEVFADLHRSVLAFTPPGTVHHVYVPSRDRGRFAAYEGPRCRIWDRSRLLPPRNVRAPLTEVHVNVRRPWPPLRGWVMQQTSKIAAAGQSDADMCC